MQSLLRRIAAVALGSALLSLPACDSVSGPDASVATVEITTTETMIQQVGGTLQLDAVARDEDGSQLADATIGWTSRDLTVADVSPSGLVTAAGNGEAWIVASSGGSADSVVVRVSPTFCPVVGELTVPDTVGGALAGAGCELESRVWQAWRLTLAESQEITVDLVSDEFDTLLFLANSAGDQIAADDDGGDGTNSRISGTMPPGDYYLYVTSFDEGATGAYELQGIVGVPPSPCPATDTITVPDTVTGMVDGDGCVFNSFYLDVWRLDVDTASVLALQVDSHDFTPLLAVADTMGAFLSFSDQGPGTGAWLEVGLQPGSYDVWMGSAQQQEQVGSYTFSIQEGPTLLECEATGTLTPTETVAGEVGPDDCYFFFSSGEVWELELADTTTVELTMISEEIRPVVLVVDSAGNPAGEFFADAETDFLEARLSLPPGRYRIWAMAENDAHGSYRLSVATGDQLPTCSAAGSVALGGAASGALSTTDCLVPPGRYADVWTLRLDATTTVDIALTSDKVDPFLMVGDSTGVRIARDDDSGGNGNAGLTLELEAGLYQLWATSYSPDEVGAYELTADIAAAGAVLSVPEHRDTEAGRGAEVQRGPGWVKTGWGVRGRLLEIVRLRHGGAPDRRPW